MNEGQVGLVDQEGTFLEDNITSTKDKERCRVHLGVNEGHSSAERVDADSTRTIQRFGREHVVAKEVEVARQPLSAQKETNSQNNKAHDK